TVDRCLKLARFLIAGRITFEEYANGVTLGIVSGLVDDMPACVETIPAGVATLYADYLRRSLEPIDVMPSPRAFLVGEVSEEEIEGMKQRLRPKYLRLYQLMVGITSSPER